MASYRIHCHTQPVGESQYLATVTAFPDGPDERIAALTAESRLFRSLETARSERQQMVESVKRRVLAQGHAVVGVEQSGSE